MNEIDDIFGRIKYACEQWLDAPGYPNAPDPMEPIMVIEKQIERFYVVVGE